MKKIPKLIGIASLLLAMTAITQAGSFRPFISGSYQKILADHQGTPFALILWSLSCSSCLKEMSALAELKQRHPEFTLVLISTDTLDEIKEINQLLERHLLTDLENWVFAGHNAQTLRFEIDPAWYGELPRTYFFNRSQQRTAISGALSPEDFLSLLKDDRPPAPSQ
ncbi:MAG: redoxin domain-containing protein [Methylomonas sp.]|nr:redoxin domain-containing protein [Methylomonas sp.]